MNDMIRIVLFFAVFLVAAGVFFPAFAGTDEIPRFTGQSQGLGPDSDYGRYTDPALGLPYFVVAEPNIAKIEFIKSDPPVSLRERVDRIVQGIKVDIPPEYDLYGYELRRYMARIRGPLVLVDKERIQQELNNIQNAKIVLRYWQAEVSADISAAKKEIEVSKASPAMRNLFNYNRGVSIAFFAECEMWIRQNEEFLSFLSEEHGSYTYKGETIKFDDLKDHKRFIVVYKDVEKARRNIVEYDSFVRMVY